MNYKIKSELNFNDSRTILNHINQSTFEVDPSNTDLILAAKITGTCIDRKRQRPSTFAAIEDITFLN